MIVQAGAEDGFVRLDSYFNLTDVDKRRGEKNLTITTILRCCFRISLLWEQSWHHLRLRQLCRKPYFWLRMAFPSLCSSQKFAGLVYFNLHFSHVLVLAHFLLVKGDHSHTPAFCLTWWSASRVSVPGVGRSITKDSPADVDSHMGTCL